MLLFDLFQNPIMVVIYLLAIALAIGVHEAAHAWTAYKFGDDTAKELGRASINPLVHLDPIGSLLFILAGFGWGKPVPVDERKLNNPLQVVWVALAGPASNFIIAIILGLIIRLFPGSPIEPVLAIFVIINLSLMLFNLIPIPPLDGSKILRLFIPSHIYFMIEQYGFLLLLGLFVVIRAGGGPAGWLIQGVDSLFRLVTGSPAII